MSLILTKKLRQVWNTEGCMANKCWKFLPTSSHCPHLPVVWLCRKLRYLKEFFHMTELYSMIELYNMSSNLVNAALSSLKWHSGCLLHFDSEFLNRAVKISFSHQGSASTVMWEMTRSWLSVLWILLLGPSFPNPNGTFYFIFRWPGRQIEKLITSKGKLFAGLKLCHF